MTIPTLVLDPGHGGSVPAGGSSPNRGSAATGLLEKDLALDLARRTRDRLTGDHVVILTRDSDTNLSLTDRATAAKALQAAAFISLHLSGADPTRDRTDVIVARSASPASRRLAESIRTRVGAATGSTGEILAADLGQLAADRHDPATAACLVEIASLASVPRAAQLTDPAFRDQLADALATAIREGLGAATNLSPEQARSAALWGRTAEIHYPEIDPAYSVSGIVDAAAIWADWLVRRASWQIGVPDSVVTTFPHAAICQLRLYDDDHHGGAVGFGTGFYIADEVLLTCGHNFYDATDGWTTTRVTVEPAYSPRTSTFPTKTFSVTYPDVVHPKWAASNDDRFDLAVLKVPGLPSTRGNFSLANMSLAQDVGIVVCGYGKVDPNNAAEEGQRLDGAHIAEADFELVRYPMMTIHGHSGSPVFHGQMVIGVHTGSVTGKPLNRAVLLTPEKEEWVQAKAGVVLTYGQGLGHHARALVDRNSTQREQSDAVRLNIAKSVSMAETGRRYDLLHYDSQRVNFGIGSWTGSRIADLLDTYESFAAGLGLTGQLVGHFGGQAGLDSLRSRFRTSGSSVTLSQTEEAQLRALGADTALQGAQDEHLANDVGRDLAAIGQLPKPDYPFVDGGMGAISELAAHVLVHARHQGPAGLQSRIREAIAHFGGEQALVKDYFDGKVTEADFLRRVGEGVAAHVQPQYQNGVRNRYATLIRDWGNSELAYYFNPA